MCIGEVMKKLKTDHKRHCFWKTADCPESFLYLKVGSVESAWNEFLDRFKLLFDTKNSLPVAKYVDQVKQQVENHILPRVKVEFDEMPYTQSAILLALTGWNVYRRERTASNRFYVSCDFCFRKVDLSLYKQYLENTRSNVANQPNCDEAEDLSVSSTLK